MLAIHNPVFIARDFSRPEEDDFKLNVEDKLQDYKEAVPVMRRQHGVYIEGRELLVGWNIQYRFE